MDDAALSAVRHGDIHGQFSEIETLCLQYADRMTELPVEVDDALFQKLRQQFSEAQMVELTAVIAWENFRTRFNHAFGLESEAYYEVKDHDALRGGV